MNKKGLRLGRWTLAYTALLLFLYVSSAHAVIDGISGTAFNFTAKAGYISTPDGGAIYTWGYADADGISGTADVMQYPGPTLIINEGETIVVNLTNDLPEPVSILFPGHEVVATGGNQGLITKEAPPDGTTVVTYTFTATNPGTYQYYSGTHPELQIEMGLVGAIIVRPTGYDANNPRAYGHADSSYKHEYLFLLTEMDPKIHDLVDQGRMNEIDNTTFLPVYWFINGRNFPDIITPAYSGILPNQPYNCLPLTNPGEKVLLRVMSAGRDNHPLHPHGDSVQIIAQDGRLLESGPGAGADLARTEVTIDAIPGETVDAIFEWTGKDLGWDFYGHNLNEATAPYEIHAQTTLGAIINNVASQMTITGWSNNIVPTTHRISAIIWDSLTYATFQDAVTNNAVEMIRMKKLAGTANDYTIERGMNGTSAISWSTAGVTIDYTDHGKPIPTVLPELQNIAFGAAYSGSPYLGKDGPIPPGEGGLNPFKGFFFPWHSHHENEIVNNDIFIGGMLTFVIVLPNVAL